MFQIKTINGIEFIDSFTKATLDDFDIRKYYQTQATDVNELRFVRSVNGSISLEFKNKETGDKYLQFCIDKFRTGVRYSFTDLLSKDFSVPFPSIGRPSQTKVDKFNELRKGIIEDVESFNPQDIVDAFNKKIEEFVIRFNDDNNERLVKFLSNVNNYTFDEYEDIISAKNEIDELAKQLQEKRDQLLLAKTEVIKKEISEYNELSASQKAMITEKLNDLNSQKSGSIFPFHH